MFSDLGPAFELLLSFRSLLLIATGAFLGIVVGAIPGLTGAMLIALALPLTFAMEGGEALTLLVSMYVGSVSGGLVTATLLRMPGTPASIMTTLDGYPLSQRGESGRALALGIGASFVGGIVSWCFLVCLAGPMADWSLTFGPFEFFALVLVALVLIASVGGRSLSLGLLSGALGVLIAMPGTSPATGSTRWTFGFHALDDGLKLLPVLIGLFAVNQIIHQLMHGAATRTENLAVPAATSDRLRFSLRDLRVHGFNLLRSSLIGTWIGILPGIGANVGSVVAYSAAKRASRHPERFGQGSEEGIVAAETANNATVGGALIPLISMGIPGSVIDAILLGALVIHGLQPGPMLMQHEPLTVQMIIGAMLLANIFTLCFLLVGARHAVYVATIPAYVLIPVVMIFCVIGSYALANRMFDVWVMLVFGAIGYGLERMRIPLAPLVIGFVLAPIGEEHLSAGLMQSGGSLLPLVQRPIAAILCLIAVSLCGWTFWQRLVRPDDAKRENEPNPTLASPASKD